MLRSQTLTTSGVTAWCVRRTEGFEGGRAGRHPPGDNAARISSTMAAGRTRIVSTLRTRKWPCRSRTASVSRPSSRSGDLPNGRATCRRTVSATHQLRWSVETVKSEQTSGAPLLNLETHSPVFGVNVARVRHEARQITQTTSESSPFAEQLSSTRQHSLARTHRNRAGC